MQSTMVKLIVLIAVSFLSPNVWAVGCGLPIFAGRAGDRLYFEVLQASQPRRFHFERGSGLLSVDTIPRGRVLAAASAENGMWRAMRSDDNPHHVIVARVTADGAVVENTSILLPFAAHGSVSWITDAQGVPWLFFDSGGDRVAAFRRDRCSWVPEGVVRSDPHIPRLNDVTGEIILGSWRFLPGRDPQPIEPLPPDNPRYPGYVHVFPAGHGELLAILPGGYEAYVLRDDVWTRLATPWKSAETPRPTLVPSDSASPVVAWRDGALLRAHRWQDDEWVEVAMIDMNRHPGGGPMLMIEETLIVMGSCYRFEDDGGESITVTEATGDVVATREVVGNGIVPR